MCGEDALGNVLESELHTRGISTFLQRIAGQPTISKLRVLSQHQQLIRLDFEKEFYHANPQPLLTAYVEALKSTQVVVLSDYAKGVLKHAPAMIMLANEAGIPVLVDPKGDDFTIYRGATMLTPNRKEFEVIVGKCLTEDEIESKGQALITHLELKALLITRGEEGMTLLCPGKPLLHITAKKREIYDVTGAGDTVIAVLAASVAAGAPLERAVVLANLAAGIVVSKLGAATVSQAELRRALQSEHPVRRGILNEAEAIQRIRDAHVYGERVVMTNGCFDILHPGHITYLEEAKKLGDYLIIAVNDDESVRRLKGPTRPINPLHHRMSVLAGLAAVDWVVPFSEDTPERLISELLPDILVKGGDYTVDQIAGGKAVRANGGQVKILSFVPGFSTTAIVERMGVA
jgi:D-beta-D-heptose 7-phosphate kinase / D-beta-D-heptose 1-phosphate adenosyltransferase